MQHLIEQHGVFKLRFDFSNKKCQQFYTQGSLENILSVIDTSMYEGQLPHQLVDQHAQILQKRFNLKKGPLVSAILFVGHSSSSASLLMVAHHLVVDGVSGVLCFKN